MGAQFPGRNFKAQVGRGAVWDLGADFFRGQTERAKVQLDPGKNAKDGIRTRASEEIGALNRRLRPTRPPPHMSESSKSVSYTCLQKPMLLQKCVCIMFPKSMYVAPFFYVIQLMGCFKSVHDRSLPAILILLPCSGRLSCNTLVLRGGSSQMEHSSDELVNAPSLLPEGLVNLARDVGDKSKQEEFENTQDSFKTQEESE